MTSTDQMPAQRAVLSAPSAPIAGMAARMREIGAALPREDGVAVFNRVYLSVTEELVRQLVAGRFADRAATRELGARFAQRYLDAVDAEEAGARPPSCWRPLFRLRRHPSIHPLQFALAGVNAHICHDLPLALLDTCRALGARPETLEVDFERIGELLTGLEEHIREELMPGPDLLDVADPLTHLIGSWSLERARCAAWAAFRALWGLRSFGELLEEMAEGLDTTVGMTGRCLLTPLWH